MVGNTVIFASDEQVLRQVYPEWTREELLHQDGIFFLKDIAEALNLDKGRVIRAAREHQEYHSWKETWETMGVRKLWNHWAVRMTVFAPYYNEHFKSDIMPIKSDWDSNELLQQTGVYLLSDVCRLLPFSTNQIRYQAKLNPRSAEEYGVWKDEDSQRFVVSMDIFSSWIKKLWSGDFRKSLADFAEPIAG